MSIFGTADNLLRSRNPDEPSRVTFVELFFDLVFVFAITQISHFLLDHFSLMGVLEATLLFLAVWWVWMYTSWVTNWLDPDTAPVRLMLFALMLAGLVMSTSLPEAFESRALPFAVAYVSAQVGRSVFMLWCLRAHNATNYRNFQRITAWLAVSGVFWIAGAFVQHELRFALWVIALAIEYVSPAVGFWTPGLGRSSTSDWDVEGDHLAERCGLFVIIALGESVLVTGATFAKMTWTAPVVGAFIVAFTGSVAMWWIYFNIGAERARHRIAESSDPGRYARLAYTYVHLLPIAGIIVSAVSDELILAHPLGHTDFKTASTTIVGFALFLIGNILFKRIMTGRPTLSHFVGLGLLALLAPLATVLPPLAFGAGATAILVIVAIWETRSYARRAKPAAV
jgi:low temperature requirement protein LtrA